MLERTAKKLHPQARRAPPWLQHSQGNAHRMSTKKLPEIKKALERAGMYFVIQDHDGNPCLYIEIVPGLNIGIDFCDQDIDDSFLYEGVMPGEEDPTNGGRT
jgi:hypothetical protein